MMEDVRGVEEAACVTSQECGIICGGPQLSEFAVCSLSYPDVWHLRQHGQNPPPPP